MDTSTYRIVHVNAGPAAGSGERRPLVLVGYDEVGREFIPDSDILYNMYM